MKEYDELEMIDIYKDFAETTTLLNEVMKKVVEVGDLHTLVELEHLLDEKKQYARQSDVSKKINEIVEESDAFEEIDCEDGG